ncbi:DNA replication ATP-dependent helicase Dna2 [Talaromyces islandicus]|uniref:DNA replication ATP-dependent helicase/nuclease n=1 Tax=Talaromyces islandicus TaxID=28573 RepID=A0A0U1LQK8_TALIS|nr:DNA replication ATP-dependent helicase Dna2 [Talaromyces islandicus]
MVDMTTKQDSFISANSRTKLSNFRYIPPAEPEMTSPKKSAVQISDATAANADKENQKSWMNGVARPPRSPTKSQTSMLPKESKPSKECPKTPANRIPLADLISNAEDAISLAPEKELTPDDYISWQPAPPQSSGAASGTKGRGKKRRHSSSPTSSPGKSCRSGKTKEPFDLKTFQAILKTPQSDIATDLWNNYVGKSKLEGALDIPAKFANLSSSPRTPTISEKTARDSSGLRRSTSCNADWPSSNAKRRRVDGYQGTRAARDIFSRSRSNVLDSGSSKKMSFLLDKIQNSLANSKAFTKNAPPSSPPIQEDRRETSPSPSRTKPNGKFAAGQHIPEVATGGNNSVDQSQTHPKHKTSSSSSDFSDDEFDDDILALVESATDPFTDSSKPNDKMTETPINRSSFNLQQSPCPVQNPNKERAAASRLQNQSDDEFDDDDDDFEEGMEELLAQYDDKRSHHNGNISSDTKGVKVQTGTMSNVSHPGGVKGAQATNFPLDNEFDDDDLDFDGLDQNALNGKPRSQQAIKRYLIVQIAQSQYVNQKGRVQAEQVLSVEDERTRFSKVITLRDSWFDTPCTKNSYIHLIGDFDNNGHCIVDDSHNMIILHPDHLISATVVADAVTCQRRAVLQDRLKATSDINKPQVFGHILHEVFQEAMKANQWDIEWMRKMVERVLVRYVESIYAVRMSMVEAVEYVMSKVPELQAWAEVFLRSSPNAESMVEDRHGSKANLSINKLLEVEEHVWSPMYGLKGNVDATVQVVYNDDTDNNQKTLTIPLEVKTGKKDTSHSHRAQTALYTLLLSDRYDIEVTFGLLYYLEMRKMFRVRGVRHELLQMIQERNRLAGYVREKTELPPMIKRSHMCKQCYSKTACFVYHKLVDNGDGETSGVGDKFEEAVGHLSPQHAEFFKRWDSLLTKEEKDMMKFRRELWTMLSKEREALGRCFSEVIIQPSYSYEDENAPKINRYQYTFVKANPAPGFSFTESQITVGEPIVISDEKGHFALANGYVLKISQKRITVAVDRRLHNARVKGKGFDAHANQSFKGIMEFENDNSSNSSFVDDGDEQMVYRLDKDEFSNGMATVRNNLVCMMEKDLFQAQQLRKLVIEGQAPSFKTPSSSFELSSSAKSGLNVDQKRAIEKVMSAKDYALVLGMPGTGKTTTIAHIIRALVSQGKSVLLTSYTHTAVDNILLKIRDDNIRILRLGATAKVHPEVQQFADLASTPKTTIEELKKSYEESTVVATTCLGVNHQIFNQRVFDYCIVDEASQITLPVCLGPIRMAKTFILVGDHYQLPPLVQNKEAQQGGLDVSLFKLLSDANPSSVTNLEHQYRMCEDIMLLSNNLIYSGRLKCGDSQVASRTLVIPSLNEGLKSHHVTSVSQMSSGRCLGPNNGRCWIKDLLEPSAKTRLVNTDTLSGLAPEVVAGSRMTNPREVTLCAQLVDSLVSSGISPREIGVITFYRSQLSLLRHTLRRYSHELEMHTADKFQGRDKEIVILSCVRSNNDNQVGELLRDWRRVNVAFTRARTKLLVIGSMSTLRDGDGLLRKYVALMEKEQWIYNLPKDALEDHVFESSDDLALSPTQRRTKPVAAAATSPRSIDLTPSKNNPKRKRHSSSATTTSFSPSDGKKIKKVGFKTPEKRGSRGFNTDKILHTRPILNDLMNEFLE